MLMHMLILGEFNVSRTNFLQSSNILPLTGFVLIGGRSLGMAGPVVVLLLTGGEVTVGTRGSSRCHKLGVPGMSAATMRSPSSLPPMSSETSDRGSGNDAEERRADP